MRRLATVLAWVLLIAVAYTGVSMFTFSFRHPELTQMQVLCSIVDAWCCR